MCLLSLGGIPGAVVYKLSGMAVETDRRVYNEIEGIEN